MTFFIIAINMSRDGLFASSGSVETVLEKNAVDSFELGVGWHT